MFNSQDDFDFTPQDYNYDSNHLPPSSAPDNHPNHASSSHFSPVRKKNRHNPVFMYLPSQGNSQLTQGNSGNTAGSGNNDSEDGFFNNPTGNLHLLSQDSQFFSQLSQGFNDRLESLTMNRQYVMSQGQGSDDNGGGEDSFMLLQHAEESAVSLAEAPSSGVSQTQGFSHMTQTSLMGKIGGGSNHVTGTSSSSFLSINTSLDNTFSVPGPPSSKLFNPALGVTSSGNGGTSGANGTSSTTTTTKKNTLTSTTTVETEKQVDIRNVTPNPFLQYSNGNVVYNAPNEAYYQHLLATSNIMSNSMPKMSKIWISPYQERSRYTTDFEENAQVGIGTFSKVTCVRNR